MIVSGGTFLITPFELKSGVELHIEADATLLASPDLADYPERENPKHVISENLPRYRNASIIYADEAENIAITGRGTIDCNGTHFVKEKTGDWKGWPYVRTVPRNESLPRVVFFAGCRNVTVTDVTMVNQPAGWSYWVHDCDLVHFDRCKIIADVRYPNNDGIHINCSRDVTVSNCLIQTGDDSIVVRAISKSLKENKPCERVVITNCTLRSWSSGIRIGWTNDGVIRHCTFSNIVMHDCSAGVAISIPGRSSVSNDWGLEALHIEGLTFSNIRMDRVLDPVYGNISEKEDVFCDAIRDIVFSDVYAKNCMNFPYFNGREDCPFEDIYFNNCSFEKLPAEAFPDATRHGAVPKASGEPYRHVNNLVMNNTRFIYK
ncbi:MAG: right-handed parallel beta-helix repeat-containing protein [Bacteroidales bacterium]|nr:right-handed parallel beta-helix repeat-containing protein [Bacteroidales bacterium]